MKVLCYSSDNELSILLIAHLNYLFNQEICDNSSLVHEFLNQKPNFQRGDNRMKPNLHRNRLLRHAV